MKLNPPAYRRLPGATDRQFSLCRIRVLSSILGALVVFSVGVCWGASPPEDKDAESSLDGPAAGFDWKGEQGKDHEDDRWKSKPPRPPKHPTAPPAPPASLLAEAVLEFQVNLSWSDQSTNELGFKLERSLDGTNYLQIAQVLPNTVVYRDNNRFPDTKYFYRARSFNAKGNSVYSAVARTQTPAPNCQLSVANWGLSKPVPPGLTNVVGIAAGAGHATVLKQDGTVMSWGEHTGKQKMVSPRGLSNVVAVAAGFSHNLALRADGTVVGWGDNSSGQADVPKKLANVAAIAAGRSHSLALKSDGTVVGWGENGCGQSSPPHKLAGVVAIAAGAQFGLALRSDGTVVTWGERVTSPAPAPEDLTAVVLIAAGDHVGLALHDDGRISSWSYSGRATPRPPENLTGVVALSGGSSRNYALRNDGTLASWGNGKASQPAPPTNLMGVIAISSRQNQTLVLTDAPVPPTGFSAKVQAVDRITLSWTNPSVPIESIHIERTTNFVSGHSTNWTTIATVPGETTSYEDTTAIAGWYRYRLQAFNACGASTYSRTTKAKLTGLADAPSAPLPQARITALTPSNHDIRISWSATGPGANVIEAAATASGPFTNLSPVIDILESGETRMEYVEAGGLTNSSSRFYRIRVLP